MKDFLRPYIPSFLKKLYRKYKKRSPSEIQHQQAIDSLKEKHLRLNKNTPQNQMVFRDGIAMYVHPDSRFGFEHFCFISPEMVEEMDQFIRQTVDKKNLLDIGALHGVFSLVFAVNNPEKKVVSIDASPLAFARLLYNIHKNKLANITALDCAISDSPGKLLMHYEWEHAVATGTLEDDKSFEIDKQTGDNICRLLNFEPDVIKIDVEGHEIKVLKGLSTIIQRLKPMVFLELHPQAIKNEGDNISELFSIFKPGEYYMSLPGNVMVTSDNIDDLKQVTRVLLKPLAN
ncbi:MAG: FkbM family methyltransferase [Parafilimonas sp.]|nr:FkbM family methyltransferase [Parafilimonas sp.]